MKIKKMNRITARLFNDASGASVVIRLLLFTTLFCAPVEAQQSRSIRSAQSAGATVAQTGQWTSGLVEKSKTGGAPAVLRNVRTSRHRDFDRVVFEFGGREIPGYHVEYVDKPILQCGSGNTVSIAGDGWLRLRFQPAQAHTDDGRATIRNRERRLRLGVLREMELTCDFEAEVEWVLGVTSPNRYRILELSNPTRLVVDIRRKG